MSTLALHDRRATFRLPAEERGRLMDPEEVARLLFFGKRKPRWVKENAPRELRVPMGKGYCYWEHEVAAWRDALRVTDR